MQTPRVGRNSRVRRLAERPLSCTANAARRMPRGKRHSGVFFTPLWRLLHDRRMTDRLQIFAARGYVVTTGCGTIATHVGGVDKATNDGAYRGRRYDCRHCTDDQGGGLLMFDMPLSAVADTLCLPFDLAAQSHD